MTRLRAVPTLTWKPVVRVRARQGLAGQLGVVAGVVAGMTPTSASVASEPLGTTSTSAAQSRRGNIALRLRDMDN